MSAPTLNIHAGLIAGCRKGDPRSQQAIYELYAKAMLNTAYRIVGVAEDAEDVLQEAFVSAFRSIHSYREEASFGAWLKRIVVNKSLTWLSARQKQLLVSEEEIPDEPEDVQWELDETNLSVSLVKNAIMDLPDGFRSVVTLYLFEGYDHKEIGEILNISESTSKSQYKRAKDKLKLMLKSEMKYG